MLNFSHLIPILVHPNNWQSLFTRSFIIRSTINFSITTTEILKLVLPYSTFTALSCTRPITSRPDDELNHIASLKFFHKLLPLSAPHLGLCSFNVLLISVVGCGCLNSGCFLIRDPFKCSSRSTVIRFPCSWYFHITAG